MLREGLILLAASIVVAVVVGLLIFLLLPVDDLARSGDSYKGPTPSPAVEAGDRSDRHEKSR